MADLINLRRARKGLERAHRQVAAAESRARHGRVRDERLGTLAEAERTAKRLDGHKLIHPDTAKDTPPDGDA